MNKRYSTTPDFGDVIPSTLKLDNQAYRAVVKDATGKTVFMSIEIFRNRDISTGVSDSARDTAKRFIGNELRAHGHDRYRGGIYSHSYKGPAPFFDAYTVEYECLNGYWVRLNKGYKIPTRTIPIAILREAKIQDAQL